MGTIIAEVLVALGKAVQQSEAALRRILVQSFPSNLPCRNAVSSATERLKVRVIQVLCLINLL